MENFDKSSKKLLIIGATASIAPSLVTYAQQRGYHVTGTYRNSSKKYDAISDWLELDLSNVMSIRKFLIMIEKKDFNIILFLAGATNPKKIDLENYLTTHFLHTISLFEDLIKESRQKFPVCFVYISSRAMKYPSFDVYYSAVKAGLVSALRSLSLIAHPESKIISILPGLIQNSQMYFEMDQSIRLSHLKRSNYELLSVEGASLAIFEVIDNKDEFENCALVEIGPTYQ